MMRARILWAMPLVLCVMIGSMSGEARARPFEEGLAAAQRGDFATALRVWVPLANRGHPNAQFNLGQMYARGDGVPQDFAKALWWYRRAADQGFAEPRFRLGVLFERGLGVPTAPLCAYMWYDLAAADGWQAAAGRRDALAITMTGAQIRWAQKMARDFKPHYPFCPNTTDAAWIGF